MDQRIDLSFLAARRKRTQSLPFEKETDMERRAEPRRGSIPRFTKNAPHGYSRRLMMYIDYRASVLREGGSGENIQKYEKQLPYQNGYGSFYVDIYVFYTDRTVRLNHRT